MAFTASWISTIWIVWQYRRMRTLPQFDQSASTRQLQFEQVLKRKSAFDLFAVHLVAEFSIENLAFILEVMQIKQDLIDNKLCSQNEVGLMIPIAPERIKRTRGRKKSERYTVNDLRENVKYLMEQYVTRYARSGVNISWVTRDRIVEIFNGLEKKSVNQKEVKTANGNAEGADGTDNAIVMRNLELFVNHTPSEPSESERELSAQYALLLDKALVEIINLLRSDSLVRFKQSKAYIKLNNDPSLSS